MEDELPDEDKPGYNPMAGGEDSDNGDEQPEAACTHAAAKGVAAVDTRMLYWLRWRCH